MLFSLALLFLCGLALGGALGRLGIPSLLGMLAAGMALGPYGFNTIDSSLLNVSGELRQIALVIILVRAGLNLRIGDLKAIGRPAVLLCFVPACFEIGGFLLLAPRLLGVSLQEAAIMGAVVAAVSPAVIVPRMLGLVERGIGEKQKIPQLIMAGASVDDVFVIVLFTTFVAVPSGGQVSFFGVVQIPLAIAAGILGGAVCGLLLYRLFQAVHMRDSAKVLVLLGVAFLLVSAEEALKGLVPFSGLLAVMAAGCAILQREDGLAKRLASKFSKLWVAAEIWLFVLVGAAVDIGYARQAGPWVVLVIVGALLLRVAGVWLSLARTPLNRKERLFCAIAFLPKATVQAAIGGIPLSMGLPCGELVLATAVVAILVTAPLGAFAIDRTYGKLLV